MKELIIKENEAGQRFDKYLAKVLKEAPKSFFYKMLRKKNITLNGKKATGNEKLLEGDTVKFFLSAQARLSRSGNIAILALKTRRGIYFLPGLHTRWKNWIVILTNSILLEPLPTYSLNFLKLVSIFNNLK